MLFEVRKFQKKKTTGRSEVSQLYQKSRDRLKSAMKK